MANKEKLQALLKKMEEEADKVKAAIKQLDDNPLSCFGLEGACIACPACVVCVGSVRAITDPN